MRLTASQREEQRNFLLRQKDQKLRQQIIKHMRSHPDVLAKFQADKGRTPEDYFDEYSYKDDIGDSVASDYNLRFPAKKKTAPKPSQPSKTSKKPFDPFEL